MRNKAGVLVFSAVIHLLWFAAVFDPVGDVFGLRYLALVSAVACLGFSGVFLQLFGRAAPFRNATILYLSFVMPSYGFFVYAVRGGFAAALRDTSYAAAGLLLLFSLLYKNEHLCRVGLRAMVFPLRLLVLVVIVMYLTTVSNLSGDWIQFFVEGQVALVSTREYAGRIFPYVYFVASPMLIYLIAYELHGLSSGFKIKKAVICGASIIAFGLSGTRAHMLLAVVFPFLFYVLSYGRNKLIYVAISFSLVVLTIQFLNVETLNALFSVREASNAAKVSMLTNYSEVLNDPMTLTFGQGYNAHAWSFSLREMIAMEVQASKTELTYLELVRVYGMLIAVPFFLLLGGLVYKLSRVPLQYRWLYPAFLIYLIDSSVNPYLFSTNGILPLGLILGIVSLNGRSTAGLDTAPAT